MEWSNKIFGLSTSEIKVLKSLTIKKNLQQISCDTSLSRSGINHIIKNLIKRGFIVSHKEGKRKSFTIINQENLFEEFKQITEHLNPIKDKRGIRIKTITNDEFIIHMGINEVIPAYSRIALKNKGERIRAIQHHRSYKEIVEKASSKLLAEFNETIKKNDIILDGILNESAYNSYLEEIKVNPKKYNESVKTLNDRMADYHIFPDNFFNYDAEIWIFKTTTLIINWHEEIAIEITNKNITNFLQDMFKFVKMGCKKIDHNELMRKIIKIS